MINNIEIFLNINIFKNEINFYAYEYSKKKTIFSKNYNFINTSDSEEIALIRIEDILRDTILEIERELKSTVDKIHLMVERAQSISINLSFKKNFENKEIDKKNIEFIIQDLRTQLTQNNPDKKFIHILIKKCLVDNEEFNYIPIGNKCKNFVIEICFVYLSKKFFENIKNLLSKNQIEINRVICTNYAKSLLEVEFDETSLAGMKAIQNLNLNEVQILSKEASKPGFFDKLFHIIS